MSEILSDFPLSVTDETLQELETLCECQELTGKDIPDDLLEAVINSN